MKYKYDKSVYINNKINIIITCVDHGDFLQAPNNHIKGSGCPLCAKPLMSRKKEIKDFIKKVNKLYNNNFDYSLVDLFDNISSKVQIKCIKHNLIFTQSFRAHIKGAGCKQCIKENHQIKLFKTDPQNHFIIKASKVHGDKYDYSKSNYVKRNSKVTIYCKEHKHYFNQTPDDHYKGITGCALCYKSTSKGERKISLWLTNNNIIFEREKTFKSCKRNKYGIMRFDFYVPLYNLLIEYDGRQHFELDSNKQWSGSAEEKLKNTIERDFFKTKWANENNYNLLRIPYTQFKNIDNILKEYMRGPVCQL